MIPNRIVSLLAAGTEMIHILGLLDRIVAISHECDYPPEILGLPRITQSHLGGQASCREIDDEVRRLSSQNVPLYEIDAKRLASLKPDLIVTQSHCDVCAISLDDVERVVRHTPELSLTRIVSLNPQNFDDVFRDIAYVGEACGVSARAATAIASLQERIHDVRCKTDALAQTDHPRTACIEWIDPVMIAANWMPDLVRFAGGQCDLAQSGQRSRYTEWDDVIQFDPEVIVVMPCGYPLKRSIDASISLRQQPEWDNMSAVRNGRVWAVDGNAYFNRSGPRMVDSLELLAHLLHPGQFPTPPNMNDAIKCLATIK